MCVNWNGTVAHVSASCMNATAFKMVGIRLYGLNDGNQTRMQDEHRQKSFGFPRAAFGGIFLLCMT